MQHGSKAEDFSATTNSLEKAVVSLEVYRWNALEEYVVFILKFQQGIAQKELNRLNKNVFFYTVREKFCVVCWSKFIQEVVNSRTVQKRQDFQTVVLGALIKWSVLDGKVCEDW